MISDTYNIIFSDDVFINTGWSLLHYAAWHGSSEVINSLVKTGAEVDLKDLVKGELQPYNTLFFGS